MTTTPTAFSEATPRQREAMAKTVYDAKIQNPRASELRAEAIRELEESVSPKLNSSELGAIHAQIWKIRECDKPRAASPWRLAR
jgi:hypothetical protein